MINFKQTEDYTKLLAFFKANNLYGLQFTFRYYEGGEASFDAYRGETMYYLSICADIMRFEPTITLRDLMDSLAEIRYVSASKHEIGVDGEERACFRLSWSAFMDLDD